MGVLPSQIQLANHDFSLNRSDFNWIRITTGRIENYRNLLSMQGGALLASIICSFFFFFFNSSPRQFSYYCL